MNDDFRPAWVDLAKVMPPLQRGPGRWLVPVMDRALGVSRFNRRLQASGPEGDAGGFFDRALEAMGIGYRVEAGSVDWVPASGPLVVVANHPFGGADALVLAHLLSRRRADLRLLANHLLARLPALRSWIVAVDPFAAGAPSARANLGPMREALRHLSGGGCLAIFPAGEVSSLRPGQWRVEDKEWTPHLATLVRRSGASVLPVCFPGANSALFQAAGLIHPRLRTALLPREFLRRAGTTVSVRIGRPIPFAALAQGGACDDLAGQLRVRVELLGQEASACSVPALSPSPAARVRMEPPAPEPVAPPEDPAAMAAEIAALPADSMLAAQGGLEVRLAAAAQIPIVLREIGRLRESTFRLAGEGTGRARDLDRFDATYLHLFLWNPTAREVAGAYRLGLTDERISGEGHRGLYTHTLFRFRRGFFRTLGPALEMGRSFVVPAYQRKPHSLFLLWRGIGAFVARHPRYRVLFGPVSISNDYSALSRGLMVQFLAQRHGDRHLRGLVGARRPFRSAHWFRRHRSLLADSLGSIEDVSAVVRDLEQDGKGVPVLLRHYLRLNGVLLRFNVDHSFADVVDGLVVVDLMRTDPKVLSRYLGADGLATFQAFHAAAPELH